jgi:tetratricopeptide (TPR) repeat protein
MTFQNIDQRRSIRPGALIVSLAMLVVMLSGCTLLKKEDTRPVESIITSAESLVARKAYADAAAEYAIVNDKRPTVGKYYMRRAELLERIEEDKQARKTYERALDHIPEEDPDRKMIILRLALINANHLFLLDDAEALLQMLPNDSIERHDLAGFLYYKSSQFDLSLKILNKALNHVKDEDLEGLLLYHSALVYRELGDEKNTFGALYHAINFSKHLGQIRDIETLWSTVNEEAGTPVSVPSSY